MSLAATIRTLYDLPGGDSFPFVFLCNRLDDFEQMLMRRSRIQTGFSLIELLVVISIVALLLALLLPSLEAARSAARSVECKSNVRSLSLASSLYAADHQGILPYYMNGGIFGTKGMPDLGDAIWYQQIADYVGQPQIADNLGLYHNPAVPDSLRNLPSDTAFDCPEEDIDGNPDGGYNYNLGLSPEFGPSVINNLDPTALFYTAEIVKRPSHTVTFSDTVDWNISIWWYWSSGSGSLNTPPFEHRHGGSPGSFNAGFVDGHAAEFRRDELSRDTYQQMLPQDADDLHQSWYNPLY